MAKYGIKIKINLRLQALRPGDTIETWKGTLVAVPRVDVILGVDPSLRWRRAKECCLFADTGLNCQSCSVELRDLFEDNDILCLLCTRHLTPCYFQWENTNERT